MIFPQNIKNLEYLLLTSTIDERSDIILNLVPCKCSAPGNFQKVLFILGLKCLAMWGFLLPTPFPEVVRGTW